MSPGIFLVKYDISLTDELFREKILRDMACLVSGPLILETEGVVHLQNQMFESVARFLGREPERLFRILSRPEPRLPLGKWFERIFLAALRITFPFAEIRHSVSDESGGELDFLIIENHLTTHIECAVKFFLRDPATGTGLSSYVGPSGQDRLDLKFHKMRDVQLRRIVPPRFVQSGRIKKVLWMSGRVHEPLVPGTHGLCGPMVSPMSPRVATGYWGPIGDVLMTVPPEEELYMLPRQWWITDLTGLSRLDLSVFEILSSGLPLTEPIMTARVRFDGDRAVELARGFIISR